MFSPAFDTDERSSMDCVMPLRILEAVRLLHRMGYGGLRFNPGLSASGMFWRIALFSQDSLDVSGDATEPIGDEQCLRYSNGEGYEFNARQFPEDVGHVTVAEEILAALPKLQRSDPRNANDRAYTEWFARLLPLVKSTSGLPIAYWDSYGEDKGWKLAWPVDRYVESPPDNQAIPTPKKDEHYVLGLCDEILGEGHVSQMTFGWLRGDPSLATGKRSKLPVDGFWRTHGIVVEFHERQHSEPVPFFDDKITATGMTRGEQRKLYDRRKAELIPQNGSILIVIEQSDFPLQKNKIARDHDRDLLIVRRRLSAFLR